jgi:hypothetical protein
MRKGATKAIFPIPDSNGMGKINEVFCFYLSCLLIFCFKKRTKILTNETKISLLHIFYFSLSLSLSLLFKHG